MSRDDMLMQELRDSRQIKIDQKKPSGRVYKSRDRERERVGMSERAMRTSHSDREPYLMSAGQHLQNKMEKDVNCMLTTCARSPQPLDRPSNQSQPGFFDNSITAHTAI